MAAVIVATFPAQAQQRICGNHDPVPHEQAVSILEKQYSEAPSSMGLTNNGLVMEMFTSESGSWTIVITMTNGFSCMLANGNSWESLPVITIGSDS